MALTYDEGEAIGEECPTCQSDHTCFESVFGFWKCEDCSSVWALDKNDPDYQDVEPDPKAVEAIRAITNAALRRMATGD